MIDFKIADGCGPTGRLLRDLVTANSAGRNAIVCWGVGSKSELPTLNGAAGAHNKLGQLVRFRAANLSVPPFWEAPPKDANDYPVLGRHLQHHGGKDISLIMQPADAALFRSDFYTHYIPRETEYRVWCYRRQHLGTYEKRLVRPERYKRVGANWNNGFAFQLMEAAQIPRDAVELAWRGVDVLGLDFGAADILRGVDGKLYLLEVNTAPGVEGENRQVIQALANKILRWERLEFPKRKGANE